MTKFIVIPQFASDGSPLDNEIYLLGDDELDQLAEQALYDADIEEAIVMSGDPEGPDAVRTSGKVFARLTRYKVESFRGEGTQVYDTESEALDAIAKLCRKTRDEIDEAEEGVDYVEFDYDDGVCRQYVEDGEEEVSDDSPALTTIVKTLADKA